MRYKRAFTIKIIYRFYKRPICSNLSLLYFVDESWEIIGLFTFVAISYMDNFFKVSINLCLWDNNKT